MPRSHSRRCADLMTTRHRAGSRATTSNRFRPEKIRHEGCSFITSPPHANGECRSDSIYVCSMNMRHEYEAPTPGDVIITSEEDGTHSVSVVPKADSVRFKEFRRAFQLAMQWANDHHGDVWRKNGGIAVRMFRVRQNETDPPSR